MKITNDYIELGLHQSCENSSCYWLDASAFDGIWINDPNGSYIEHVSGPSRSKYFSLYTDADELAYVMPCVQILVQPDGNAIYVQNGGDRVRWLLENIVGDEIPVAIYRDIGIEKAGTGLILRRVQANDVIRVQHDFDPERVIAGKLVQRATIQGGMLNDQF